MTEAEAMQEIATAIRAKYGKDIIIMACPPKQYNADCPITDDKPCTGGADVDVCHWTCDDDDGNHYPCECECHAR